MIYKLIVEHVFICLHNTMRQSINLEVLVMSFILICSFLFFVVVLRACIQRIKTGDFGVRMASPKAPMIEILPGTIFVLSFGFTLIIVVLNQKGVLPNIYELPKHAQWVGFIVGMSGVHFTIISQYQMGNAWRIGVDSDERTALKTKGLYAKSRNPIYFGILLFWIGICMTLMHPLLWLCAGVSWWCIELIVRRVEEPYLARVHGKTFLQYKNKTNRYLPL